MAPRTSDQIREYNYLSLEKSLECAQEIVMENYAKIDKLKTQIADLEARLAAAILRDPEVKRANALAAALKRIV